MAYLDAAAGAKRESAAGAVGSADIATGGVATADLADAAVTTAKLAVPKITKISETFLKSAFTDGGGTSGTKALATQVPVGAVFLYSVVTVNVAWSGDTTAVMIIGDGSDTDRYNTGTPSILTTGAKEFGPPSGNRFHPTAATVTLTVTGGADFTSIQGTASVTVDLYYLATA